MRNRSLVRSLLIAGVVASIPSVGRAQSLTGLELKCMLKTGMSEAKFVQYKFRCVSKCWYEYWHSGANSPFDDCLPPYGGATAVCISDALKGAEVRFSSAIVKACTPAPTRDCPECWSGGDCNQEAESRVNNVEAQLDAFVPGIFCERETAMPQTQWCERGVAKYLTKLVAGEHKCYAKCNSNAFKGLVNPNDCQPPASEPATGACLYAIDSKVAAAIDKICNNAEVPHSEPACPNVGDYPDGAAWANLAGVWTAGEVAGNYCGSPSGAFVE